MTVGTCSLCGGRVTTPDNWMATVPPVPECQSCGARPVNPHGPVIQMDPQPYRRTTEIANGDSTPGRDVFSSGVRLK